MKLFYKSAAAIAVLAAMSAGSASAQSAGQWTVKAGIGQITPEVHSGEVTAPALPHTKADVKPDTRPVFSIAYGITDHVSAALDLGVPFRHDIVGAGAIAGTGKLGSTKALPPTALIQYRFNAPSAIFRPYLGLGVTYAHFRDEKGSGQLTAITNIGSSTPVTFNIDDKVALTAQAGLVININQRWFADFTISKARLRTDVHYSTGQTQDMRLDPKFVSAAVGYKS
jgi:outer membrane protein